MEREVESGSVREVGNDHGIWVVRAKLITISTMRGSTHQVFLYVREVQ